MFPVHFFRVLAASCVLRQQKKAQSNPFFVKYDKLSLLSAINTCDKDVSKMENEEWEMEIEKWEIVVSVHTILKFGSCRPTGISPRSKAKSREGTLVARAYIKFPFS